MVIIMLTYKALIHNKPHKRTVAEMQETKRSVVIGPDSGFIFMWLFLVATATLYNLWSTIAREAFFDESGFGFWLFFDIFADAIYVGDIFVQARTGFLDNGLIVTDTNRLLRRLGGWRLGGWRLGGWRLEITLVCINTHI